MGLLSESSRDAGRGKEETVLARGDLYGERENLEERIWSFLDRDGSGAA